MFGAIKKLGSDIGDATNDNLIKTTRATGRVVTGSINLLGSSVSFGLNEVADNIDRADHLLSVTIPECSTKLKDGVGDVGSAAVKLGGNQLKRMKTLGKVTIKALDNVTDTATTEGTRLINGTADLVQAGIQAVGKVGQKLGEVPAKTISDVGDVAVGMMKLTSVLPHAVPSPCVVAIAKAAKIASVAACIAW